MDFTPVKIRGKKRPRQSPASPGRSSPATRALRKKHTITSGRPSSSRPTMKQAKPLTPMEALPTEILLIIFRYTDYAINLPLATPILGAKLSSKQTYKEVCASAFPRNICRALWTGHPKESVVEQARIQTEILQRRWCTLSFLEDVERIRKGDIAHEYFEPCGYPLELTRKVCGCPLVLAPGTLLPAKVLHGPWDSSKIAFLQLLLRRGAGIDWENTSLGEVAKSSLYEAVRENNLVVISLLLHDRIGINVPPDILRYAVIKCGCNRSVVSALLLRVGALKEESTIDPALWKWAQDARDSGKLEGEWLLKTLKMVMERGVLLDPDDE